MKRKPTTSFYTINSSTLQQGKKSTKKIALLALLLSLSFASPVQAVSWGSFGKKSTKKIDDLTDTAPPGAATTGTKPKEPGAGSTSKGKNTSGATNVAEATADGSEGEVKKGRDLLKQVGKELTAKKQLAKYQKLRCRKSLVEDILAQFLHPEITSVSLTAPSGVGKSVTAECLARLIAGGTALEQKTVNAEILKVLKQRASETNEPLENLVKRATHSTDQFFKEFEGYEVWTVNANALIGGAKFRGEYERRLKELIDYAEREKVILHFEEYHQFASLGDSGGQSTGGALEILKDPMARGDLWALFTTTDKEYEKYVMNNLPFVRRIVPFTMEIPNDRETFDILTTVADRILLDKGIEFSDEALKTAVKLGNKLPGFNPPSGAVLLLNQVANASSLLGRKTSKVIYRLEEETKQVLNKIKDVKALGNQNKTYIINKKKELEANLAQLVKSYDLEMTDFLKIRLVSQKVVYYKKMLTRFTAKRQSLEDHKEMFKVEHGDNFDLYLDSLEGQQLERQLAKVNRIINKQSQRLDAANEQKVVALEGLGYSDKSTPDDIVLAYGNHTGMKDPTALSQEPKQVLQNIDSALTEAMADNPKGVQTLTRGLSRFWFNTGQSKAPVIFITFGRNEQKAKEIARIIGAKRLRDDSFIEIDLALKESSHKNIIGLLSDNYTGYGPAPQSGLITDALSKNAHSTFIIKGWENPAHPEVLDSLDTLLKGKISIQVEKTAVDVQSGQATFILESSLLNQLEGTMRKEFNEKPPVNQLADALSFIRNYFATTGSTDVMEDFTNTLTNIVKKSLGIVNHSNLSESDLLEVIAGNLLNFTKILDESFLGISFSPKASEWLTQEVKLALNGNKSQSIADILEPHLKEVQLSINVKMAGLVESQLLPGQTLKVTLSEGKWPHLMIKVID